MSDPIAVTDPTSTAAAAAPGAAAPAPTSIAGGADPGQPSTTATVAPDPTTTQHATAAEGGVGAPEKYEFQLPQGVVDDGRLQKFEPLFKELGLTNEAAQKLVTAYAEDFLASEQSIDQRLTEQHEAWKSTVLKDPELGGNNYANTERFAQSAVAKFGTQGLKDYLNQTGLGSHPELVRFCAKIGQAMSEDTIHVGNRSGGDDSLRAMYPSMFKD